MSSRGRCFRARRRTMQRKARQAASVVPTFSIKAHRDPIHAVYIKLKRQAQAADFVNGVSQQSKKRLRAMARDAVAGLELAA
jgi:hypothetical protein